MENEVLNEKVEEYRFKNHKEWFQAMQEAPNPKWIKSRSLSGTKTSRYVPLGIQEALADLFFREVDVIDNIVEVYNGQILVRIKLSILPNYPNSEHRIISGVGAKVVTKAGNSLEYGAPSAQSAAKSNSLTNFANIFGRNLNREFADNLSYVKAKEQVEKETK